jgi:NAD(P)-dependent dehydrogenase (short-subunit alcohol dehydrogenase family)
MDVLAGKVAVVTGGASGIGRAVAGRAAAEGMKIVLADIEEFSLQEAARSLSESGAEVLAVVTDVSDASSVEAMRDRTLERFGAVHLVHNNAGVFGGERLMWTISDAEWRWILGVNLFGVIHGIRTFVPLLVEQGEGHVVNTASVAGLSSPPGYGSYSASKHAVVTISEILYRDLRLAGSTVGVSVLCPGYVRTRITEADRNRPVWAPAPPTDPVAEQMRAITVQAVAEGIDPAMVASHVLDAVRTNRFYILTHPEFNVAIALRMQDILEGRVPTTDPDRERRRLRWLEQTQDALWR